MGLNLPLMRLGIKVYDCIFMSKGKKIVWPTQEINLLKGDVIKIDKGLLIWFSAGTYSPW